MNEQGRVHLLFRHHSMKFKAFLVAGSALLLLSESYSQTKEWPSDSKVVEITSTTDGVIQHAYYWRPENCTSPVPLVVGLHTWSGNYTQSSGAEYIDYCQERGWALIHPHFRGPDRTPEACGSELALRDIKDAVEWVQQQIPVDPSRIYVVGVSGGGHAALMAAARWPKLWAAVSAWVPPADLAAWHAECKASGHKYWQDIEGACGGPPGVNEDIDEQYKDRSPVFRLQTAAGIPIEIGAGVHDGHGTSVPISHTLYSFNVLAKANGFPEQAVSDELISEMVTSATVPAGIVKEAPNDPTFDKTVLFRRIAGPARVTIFDGGHEMQIRAAFAWLEQYQRKDR